MTKLNVKINKLPKSEVEIEGELEADVFEGYFDKALKKLGEHVEIDGFRKGKAPESVLASKIPEMKILEEMAEMALAEYYPKIIGDEKLDVISRPEINITKLARKNPLTFKIKTALMPEIKLPEYKKLANKIITEVTPEEKNVEVTDKEVEDTILDIRKSRAPKVHIADKAMDEAHVHDENCKHEDTNSAEERPSQDTKDLPPQELPEFNDDFVKGLGPFEGVEDFKKKLKENIKLEKENQLKEKTRLKIVEKIIDETKVDLPEILVQIELDKILYRMESDITQMGLKFEDYLKHLNKTKEDIRKEFTKDAEKKAKLGLVLSEIAKLEKISADKEQVEKEVLMILEHYKDADPERVQIHAENVLANEAVFQFLEKQ